MFFSPKHGDWLGLKHFFQVPMTLYQGWEFALWFFMQIACFLSVKEGLALLKERIALLTLFEKSEESNSMFF